MDDSGTVLWRRSALGDVVLLGAVTGQLRGPVAIATAPEWVEVAQRLPGVSQVIPWPKGADPRSIGAPAGRWIDLQGGRKGWNIPATVRVDKHDVARRLRLLRIGMGRPSVVSLYARTCGVEAAKPPWIAVPDAPRDALVLVPGAAWATKRWSPAFFAAVGQSWAGPVVVAGGPDEGELCRSVADSCGAAVVAERGFARVIDVFSRAAVVVSGDSGLMHLAGACGARVVALFGPTHPDDGFFAWPGEVVSRELWCRPCTLHGRKSCPLGHHRCMDLAPHRVIAAVRRQASA